MTMIGAKEAAQHMGCSVETARKYIRLGAENGKFSTFTYNNTLLFESKHLVDVEKVRDAAMRDAYVVRQKTKVAHGHPPVPTPPAIETLYRVRAMEELLRQVVSELGVKVRAADEPKA